MAAPSAPYIGSKISLVSISDVRYEGVLYTIDPNESTVALQNVKCFGTEDRRTGSDAIPAAVATYEFIIFRGQDIKDLHVIEPDKPADPAIVSTQKPENFQPLPANGVGAPSAQKSKKSFFDDDALSAPTDQSDNTRRGGRDHNGYDRRDRGPPRDYGPPRQPYYDDRSSYYRDAPRGPPRDDRRQQQQQQQRERRPRHSDNYAAGEGPGTGGFLAHEKNKKNKASNNNKKSGNKASKDASNGDDKKDDDKDDVEQVAEKLGEFDFQASNQQFDKSEFINQIHQKLQKKHVKKDDGDKGEDQDADDSDSDEEIEILAENEEDMQKPSYDKGKSFFDDISTDKDKSRINARSMRQQDVDTFGQAAATHKSGNRNNRKQRGPRNDGQRNDGYTARGRGDFGRGGPPPRNFDQHDDRGPPRGYAPPGYGPPPPSHDRRNDGYGRGPPPPRRGGRDFHDDRGAPPRDQYQDRGYDNRDFYRQPSRENSTFEQAGFGKRRGRGNNERSWRQKDAEL